MNKAVKIIALTIALLMLCQSTVLCAEQGSAYEIGDNILTDGDFEVAEQFWDISEVFCIERSTVKSGYQALKVLCNGTKNTIYSREANATVNAPYRLGLWIKTNDLRPFDALTVGIAAGDNVIASKKFDGTLDWTYVDITTDSSVNGSLRAFIETNDGSEGTAYIDDMTICPMIKMIYDSTEEVKEEEQKLLFSDIGDSQFKDEIQTVYSLGVIDAETTSEFSPQKAITRGEFADAVLKLTGMVAGAAASGGYVDVPASHTYYRQIMAVTALGYMAGHGDGMFMPENQVTADEVIKVFVNMLNRKAQAEGFGGYPSGYNKVASSVGLRDGMQSVKGDAVINKEQLAMLVYNLLEADAYSETGYSPDLIRLSGLIPFSELFLDIKIDEGIVSANRFTAINSSKGTERDTVFIDDEEYSVNMTNAGDLLGYNVKYYAKKQENAPDTLLYVSVEKGNDKVFTLTDEQILSSKLSSNRNFVIEYENESGRSQELRIGLDCDVIYNGVYCKAPTEVDFLPKMGSITFVDNDRDSDYDVLFVSSAVVYRVSDASANRKIIVDTNGKPQLDFVNTEDENLIIKKDGKDISFSEIAKDDLMFVYQSKQPDNVHTVIEIYNNTKTGNISQVNANKEMVIASYRCPISQVLFSEAVKDESGNIVYTDKKTDSVKTCISGTAWFDKNGRIVDFEVGGMYGERYGYLVACANVYNSFDRPVKFKIFDEDGVFL